LNRIELCERYNEGYNHYGFEQRCTLIQHFDSIRQANFNDVAIQIYSQLKRLADPNAESLTMSRFVSDADPAHLVEVDS
jgi:hypothetical protein